MTTTKTFQEYQAEKREREWSDKVKAQKEAMGNAERVKRATDWKQIGNDKFKAGNLYEARDYYREAIIFVEDLVEARRKERNDLLVPLYSNLAQVYLKLDSAAPAEEVAGKALAIAEIPRNAVPNGMRAKAQFRRGLARKSQGKLEEARDDLAAALQLQPGSEEVSRELASVRATLTEQAQKAREAMGGFLQRQKESRADREEKKRQEERRREERRKERLALAEQRQQMQTAFEKLSQGSMLYEKREKEMEPVRKKEQEKRNTLELEQNLLNILDEAKGKPKTDNFDKFMEQKLERCKEQSAELDQKKKILDKQKKEQQWDEDDVWKGQRDDHRKRAEAEREAGLIRAGPRAMWEAKEVARWCEQRLRDMLLSTYVDGEELSPALAARATAGGGGEGEGQERGLEGCHLRAIVTDVLKLVGDASVVRLNPHKPPLHYFDYFLKLDWEVAVAQPGERAYRSADELIGAAAKLDDGKAPPSVTRRRLSAGTFKIKEFSSEEIPPDGLWQLAVKVKRPCEAEDGELPGLAAGLRERLREKVARLLSRWVDEYREHWP